MSKITKVIGRQIFDSRGFPTVEVQIFSGRFSAKAICPSGASTGSYEAYEKRDQKRNFFLGKSVKKVVNIINNKISKKIINLSIHDQEKIDSELIKLDGTKQKKN